MQRNTGQARRLVLALALLGALFWGAPARAAGSEPLLGRAPGGGHTVELVADARGGEAWDEMQVPRGIQPAFCDGGLAPGALKAWLTQWKSISLKVKIKWFLSSQFTHEIVNLFLLFLIIKLS